MNITPLFKKLNLKDQEELVVIQAPDSFEPELEALEGRSIVRDAEQAAQVDFWLAFVTKQEEVNRLAKAAGEKAQGDAVVWFAYPKGTSKKYTCEFNRDTGWDALGENGFEAVRQVAIDEDWSALRFRRVEYIQSMKRKQVRAMTPEGQKKVGGEK